MKTIQIFNYNFDTPTDEELKKTKWKHGEIFDGDPLKVVRELYKKTNLNIAIHGRDNITIFVTMHPRFSQR